MNIPQTHWYLSILLIYENAQLLLDSLQSYTTTARHQKAADTIWAWKQAIWDNSDTRDLAPSLQPPTTARTAHLATDLWAGPSKPPANRPPWTSTVGESTQQVDGTSCGVFMIARLITVTRG